MSRAVVNVRAVEVSATHCDCCDGHDVILAIQAEVAPGVLAEVSLAIDVKDWRSTVERAEIALLSPIPLTDGEGWLDAPFRHTP